MRTIGLIVEKPKIEKPVKEEKPKAEKETKTDK